MSKKFKKIHVKRIYNSDYITVGQMMDELKKCDRDDIIIMSKDEEGNNFSPYCDLSRMRYKPHNGWSGEVGHRKLTKKMLEHGYDETDIIDEKEGINAIVLYPCN